VTLSYLTTGLSWKADYVALFDEKQGTVGINGWVTLINRSGTSFRDAKTQLIAGDINLANSSYEYWQRQQTATRTGGTGTSSQTSIADYDIFALPERVTIADNQTKQVAFLDLHVKAEKAYEYRTEGFDSSDQPLHAEVALKFNNTNKPLPSGVVRVYMRDTSGDPKFVGEDAINQTPAGSDLGIKIGEAFDVTVQPTVVTSSRVDRWQTRYSMSYRVHNALSHAVTVNIRQGGIWRNGKVGAESLPSKRVDAHTLAWSVPVPANGETVLTFSVDTGY
jgi:hypothetical protein